MTKKTKKEVTLLIIEKKAAAGLNFKNKDFVQVKAGYARNYLLPNKVGLMANSAILSQYSKKQKEKDLKKEQEFQKCLKLKERLEQIKQLTIEKRAGLKNKIFGTITPKQITELLAKKIDTPFSDITIQAPEIKDLGNYLINVVLHPKVSATIQLEIVPKL